MARDASDEVDASAAVLEVLRGLPLRLLAGGPRNILAEDRLPTLTPLTAFDLLDAIDQLLVPSGDRLAVGAR